MLWIFERASEQLQCEIRLAEGEGFELVWTQDGATRVEHFASVDDATARRREMDKKLKEDGWKRIGRETPPKRFL